MDSFHEYMKQQLKRYIKEEQKKGVPIEHIVQILLNAGHENNVLDEVVREMQAEQAGAVAEQPADAAEKDIVANLKASILGFMGQATAKEAKEAKAEIKKGGSEAIVEEAIQEDEVEQETFIAEGTTFYLYIAALVVLTLFTAGQTGDDFVYVAMGLAPAFLNTFISFALIRVADYVPGFMLLPAVVGGAFYALGATGRIPIMARMEVDALAIINVVLALFFNLALIVVHSIKPKPITQFEHKEPVAAVPHHHPSHIPAQPVMQEPPHIRRFESHIDDLRKEFNLR